MRQKKVQRALYTQMGIILGKDFLFTDLYQLDILYFHWMFEL